MVTKNDIRVEHEASLSSLTQTQRRALARLSLARERSWTANRSTRENLRAVFEEEAARRNRVDQAIGI